MSSIQVFSVIWVYKKGSVGIIPDNILCVSSKSMKHLLNAFMC